MGIFDKITDTEVSKQGIYFQPGDYIVSIEKCKTIQTRKNGAAFVVECSILESGNPSRPAGSSCDFMAQVERFDSAMKDVKAFLASAMGLDPLDPTISQHGHRNHIKPEFVEYVCSDSNPLKGRQLAVHCFSKITKEAKKEIFPCRFSPVTQAA